MIFGYYILISTNGSVPEQAIPMDNNSLKTAPVQSQSLSTGRFVVLNTSLPESPGTIMVYRIENEISREEALSLGKQLGFSNTGMLEGDIAITFIDGDRELLIEWLNGRMIYADFSRLSKSDPRDRPENLPSPDKAVQIAKEYLLAYGLFPDDAEFASISHGGTRRAISTDGSVDTIVYQDWQVHFVRKPLNGFTLTSDGITVTVAGGGDIIRLEKYWGTYVPYREYPMITPEEEKFQTDDYLRLGMAMIPPDAIGYVNNIDIVYFTDPSPITKQTYLRPAYWIRGVWRGDGSTQSFSELIPAVPELGQLIELG